jgi:predicted Fe-S protein YdhL (DUF1289 family)
MQQEAKAFGFSPCDGSCSLNGDKNLCTGCFRTIEEIISWHSYTQEFKNLVYEKIEERKSTFQNRTQK